MNELLPAGAALIMIYERYIVLNRQAVELLNVKQYVQFSEVDGYVRINATFSPAGHRIEMRRKGCRINSTSLARWLAARLEGQGVYRIQSEYTVPNIHKDDDLPCYEIFRKRYKNKIKCSQD